MGMVPAMKWLIALALMVVPCTALAQSESLGEAEGTAEIPVTTEPASPQPPPEEKAQADVDTARKLIKIQRYEEAARLLEDAFITLEDPELLRLLGELWEAAGEKDKALQYYKTYVGDVNVGERAKEPVQRRIAALGETDDEESNLEKAGLAGWKSQGAGGGEAGGWFLTGGGRFAYNEGGEFTAAREVDGETVEVNGMWNHAGMGLEVEVGTYLTPSVGLGLRLGVDWMTWENQARSPVFATAASKGLRPDAGLNLRWYPGLGFHAGLTVGADLIMVTDAGVDACEGDDNCPVVDEGLQAARLFYGPLLGYRTGLARDLAIGVDFSFRHLPVYLDAGGSVGDLPGYSDASWMFTFALTLNYNL